MSDQQLQHEEQLKATHELIKAFLDYTVDHPHVMLGTYLRSMSIAAGLAMRMCDIEKQHISDALDEMRRATLEAYKQAEDGFAPATLQ